MVPPALEPSLRIQLLEELIARVDEEVFADITAIMLRTAGIHPRDIPTGASSRH
jgi:hypothetical protein